MDTDRTPIMKALILVDIQNDFVPGGTLAVKDGDAIVPIVNELQKKFDLIVATQDWHPADHASFAANHPGTTDFEEIELNGLKQRLWPVHCVQNTQGADFVSGLDQSRVSKVFRKGTDADIDSYSGFFDNDHRKSTGLANYLKQRGVTEVYVCGLATDFCVKATALDSVQASFQTFVIEDACRGVNMPPGAVEKALQEMRSAGVILIQSANSGKR